MAWIVELETRLAAVVDYEQLEPKVLHCWHGDRHRTHDISPVGLRTNRVEWESELAERERLIELTSPAAQRARFLAMAEMQADADAKRRQAHRELRAQQLADHAHLAQIQADHAGPWGRGAREDEQHG